MIIPKTRAYTIEGRFGYYTEAEILAGQKLRIAIEQAEDEDDDTEIL